MYFVLAESRSMMDNAPLFQSFIQEVILCHVLAVVA
jgi:hypothetical protein